MGPGPKKIEKTYTVLESHATKCGGCGISYTGDLEVCCDDGEPAYPAHGPLPPNADGLVLVGQVVAHAVVEVEGADRVGVGAKEVLEWKKNFLKLKKNISMGNYLRAPRRSQVWIVARILRHLKRAIFSHAFF